MTNFTLNNTFFQRSKELQTKYSVSANEPKISKAKIAFVPERLFESELKR